MITSFKLLFYFSLYLLLHTYILYPIFIFILFFFKKKNPSSSSFNYPHISTITSVYNESSIIYAKIKSLLDADYPQDKLSIFIGSDASNDNSPDLIKQLANQNSNIYFHDFKDRRGKAKVINDLMDLAYAKNGLSDDHILVFTDANVILLPNTLNELVNSFSNPNIGLVDSRIMPVGIKTEGISRAENTYMNLESKLKYIEGQLWGTMMGAFGGCFAIRSSLTRKVPDRFLMDDFYISMGVLDQGKSCISNLNALCTEAIPSNINEEFKRKLRISAGNFQNLFAYRHFLWTGPWTRWFSFLSHKVLRWIGPFLMIILFLSSMVLICEKYLFYQLAAFAMICFFIAVPTIDLVFDKLNWHIKSMRSIRYFVTMNIALIFGFIKYLKGVKTSSWEPPKRFK